MKIFFRLMVVMALAATLSACGTPSPHCTPQLGISGDLDVGPVGVSGGLGVHSTNGTCVPQGGQLVQQRQPGEVTARIMSSLETATAPIASKGLKQRRMDCNINESNGQGGYFCNSAIHAESTEVFGQPVAPGGRRDQY